MERTKIAKRGLKEQKPCVNKFSTFENDTCGSDQLQFFRRPTNKKLKGKEQTTIRIINQNLAPHFPT